MEKKNRNVRIISGTTEDIAEMLIELLVDENEKDKFKSKIDEYNSYDEVTRKCINKFTNLDEKYASVDAADATASILVHVNKIREELINEGYKKEEANDALKSTVAFLTSKIDDLDFHLEVVFD